MMNRFFYGLGVMFAFLVVIWNIPFLVFKKIFQKMFEYYYPYEEFLDGGSCLMRFIGMDSY